MDVRIPLGTILKPIRPAALSCRTHLLGRTLDLVIGTLGQHQPKFMTAAGYSDSPHFFYSGYRADGSWYQVSLGKEKNRLVSLLGDGRILLSSSVRSSGRFPFWGAFLHKGNSESEAEIFIILFSQPFFLFANVLIYCSYTKSASAGYPDAQSEMGWTAIHSFRA